MPSVTTLPSPPPEAVKQKESTAELLERLSSAIGVVINEHDFDFTSDSAKELIAHIAPDMKSQLDTCAQDANHLTWEEQVSQWRQRAKYTPDVRFHLDQIASDVNEDTGRATVFMEMTVHGIENVTLQAMNDLKWRRKNGQWMLYHMIGLRGSTANTGFVPPG
ncbi:hypothetical protein BAUCODRAFT_147147 [Baudoinia panamericana UAMH 10762]|uniref:SnoaL-like domain-containing protein n=1 Tax=Baudoinia panamericana (strain UAMH 10762) TaxID=717646 RepID=M2NCP6_BAUPA|nr:uncharacterized protein BAUCODRAFT_147147 [Baudoinia panamericana UAMH 10762]EMC96954.1 hypothetical protein BAUCODRAFT_147147 [Baudoinia panamericana UAMH 10762]